MTVAAVWVRVRGRPGFLAAQTVAAALLVGGRRHRAGVPAAVGLAGPPRARCAALVCLAAAVIAAGRLPADAATVIWGIAALGAPLAVVPLAGGPGAGRWPCWPRAR